MTVHDSSVQTSGAVRTGRWALALIPYPRPPSPPPPPAVPNKLFLVPHKLYGFCGRRVPRKEKNGYKSEFARWSACMLHVGRWGGVGAGSAEPSPTHPCLVYDLFSRAGNSPHPYRLIWSHLSGAQLRPVWRHREMIR